MDLVKFACLIAFILTTASCLPNPKGKSLPNRIDRSSNESLTSERTNLNGCPTFPKSCRSECLTISSTGCVLCQCPSPSGECVRVAIQGALTGSAGQQNNNGCPEFDSECDTSCISLDSMGCPVCECKSGGQSQVGSISSSASSASSSQGNNNGCSPFPKDCKSECASIDSRGCIVCQCPNQVSQLSSSQSNNNNNGCPSISKTCASECVTIDSIGCVVCSCPASGSQSSSSSLSSSSNGNNNGCPAFPKTCKSECTTVDSVGCVACACPDTGSSSRNTSSSTNDGSKSQFGGYVSSQTSSSGNSNGCAAHDASCPAECTSVDEYGCVICTCKSSISSSSSTSECPSMERNCPAANIKVDAKGCVICDEGAAATVAPFAGGCPSFDFSKCDPSCVTIDSMGCISCQCKGPGSATTPSSGVTEAPGAGGCPSFDLSTCDPNCVVMDTLGCLSCTCSGTKAPSTNGTGSGSGVPGSGSAVPGAGGCTSFDFSTCDPNCVVMDSQGCLSCQCSPTTQAPDSQATPAGGSGTAVPGAGGCPSFDFSTCDPSCVVVDSQGCMSCKCTGTTNKPSNGTNGSGVTSVPGAGGCPAFDFGTCDPTCVTMDAQGCMSCKCSATPQPSNNGTTGPGNGTPVPGAGGCPPFDFSTCEPNCAVVDSQGCMSCKCTTTPQTPDNGTTPAGGSGTAVPGAGGCPSFDFSTCDPSCVIMDSQGCLSCHCSPTASTKPSASTTTAASSAVPGAGGCPSFDFGTCDPNCVAMDPQGCLSCTCTGITGSPPGESTSGTASVVPGAGGCPSFDFSTCDPSCAVVDSQGCMSCKCGTAGTTRAPSSGGNSGSGAGGCPSFDFMSCDPNCVSMDGQGCLSCNCVATSSAETQTTAATSVRLPVRTSLTTTTQVPTTLSTLLHTTEASAIQTTRSSNVCAPVRCLYPCDAGIVLNADHCPECKCRDTTTEPLVIG